MVDVFLVLGPVFLAGVLFGVILDYKPTLNVRKSNCEEDRLRDRVTFLEDSLRYVRNKIYEESGRLL